MARIGIPVWQGRVSPVFDTAGRLLVVEADGDREMVRSESSLPDTRLPRRVGRLAELGVEVLICGGISRPLLGMVTGSGIRVVPWVAGDVQEVLEAYLGGRLLDPRFLMPGCMGRGRGQCMRRRGPGGGGPRRAGGF